ncbi:hypothetical protein HYFRA_00007959 [Hymenoscyphus fraxineus]|uniref:Uncharacterized protein n=1 Tax=Hymenoscyphus fraxineus TaxID=746836 RepID=A0A9N9KSH0_9HELO|nr:hypothetical protein HYFRA_00007959 [Hymenoscyphus fraxineus]
MSFLVEEIDFIVKFHFTPLNLIILVALFFLLKLVPRPERRQFCKDVALFVAPLLYIRILSNILKTLRPDTPLLSPILRWYRLSGVHHLPIVDVVASGIFVGIHSRRQWQRKLRWAIALGCAVFIFKVLGEEFPTLWKDSGNHLCYTVFPSHTRAQTFQIFDFRIVSGLWATRLLVIVLLRFHEHYFGLLEDAMDWALPERDIDGNRVIPASNREGNNAAPAPSPVGNEAAPARNVEIPHIALAQIPPPAYQSHGPPPPYMPRNLRQVERRSVNTIGIQTRSD